MRDNCLNKALVLQPCISTLAPATTPSPSFARRDLKDGLNNALVKRSATLLEDAM